MKPYGILYSPGRVKARHPCHNRSCTGSVTAKESGCSITGSSSTLTKFLKTCGELPLKVSANSCKV